MRWRRTSEKETAKQSEIPSIMYIGICTAQRQERSRGRSSGTAMAAGCGAARACWLQRAREGGALARGGILLNQSFSSRKHEMPESSTIVEKASTSIRVTGYWCSCAWRGGGVVQAR